MSSGKGWCKLEPTADNVTAWLKGNFRNAMKEIFADEITELWNDFVGDTPELKKQSGMWFMQPDGDMSSEVFDRKAEIEKVLAFKPIADAFLDQQEEELDNYVDAHIDYLKGLLADKVGSGIGASRAPGHH